MKLSVQLYSVNDAAKADLASVIQRMAAIGFDGVELSGLHGNSATEIRRVLDDNRIVASSAHADVFNPVKWEEIEAEATTLGYRHLVGGFWEQEFASTEAVRLAAEVAGVATLHFNERGFELSYHNHWFEYDAPNKGDLLLELCPKLRPQFDVYWVAAGGADPIQYVQRYADRVKLLHLKDGPLDRALAMTALGQGKVDIAGVVRAGLAAQVEWGIVELDRCDTDVFEALQQSHDYLRSLLAS